MSVGDFLISTFIVFGGVIGYIFQYRDIRRTNDSSGFSPFVCFILLISNILRVIFWYGKRFETPLLLQSIVMIFFQFGLLELCVRVKRSKDGISRPRIHIIKDFWDWTFIGTYIRFLSTIFVTVAFCAVIFDQPAIWELVGTAALGIEAMLGVPQGWSNYKRKSTEGCSKELITSWFLGDLSKIVLFIIRDSPAQFIACGAFQLFMDFFILGQMQFYKGSVKHDKLEKQI